ncbi:MAG: aminotransferase class V-fold PLP-dependent enzyme, partial [Armatimonadetes bacterium]|nr:aminotransferase class V-fold PLP-dependent enzyme [Armatimonadota bacterium]
NHSLGRPLDQMAVDVAEGLDVWYTRMDGAWDSDAWSGEIASFRAQIAQLIGLSDPTTVVPKTSAGQGLRAVLNALPVDGSTRPVRVVSTRTEFDSIDHILKTYTKKGRAEVSWAGRTDHPITYSVDVIDLIKPGIDLVVISLISFTMGDVCSGIREVIAAAHAIGALVLIDAYHAAGVIPIDMEELDADFMIGGSYKYTRGGPGACWLAIHPRHLGLRTLDTGWFAKKNPFGYERPDEPELSSTGDAWLESTPPVLTLYQARAGLELTLELGVHRLREYNLSQQQSLYQAFRDNGIDANGYDDPDHGGAFAWLLHRNAGAVTRALKAAGVNVDSRGTFIRFGPDILNSEAELREAASITKSVL